MALKISLKRDLMFIYVTVCKTMMIFTQNTVQLFSIIFIGVTCSRCTSLVTCYKITKQHVALLLNMCSRHISLSNKHRMLFVCFCATSFLCFSFRVFHLRAFYFSSPNGKIFSFKSSARKFASSLCNIQKVYATSGSSVEKYEFILLQ